MTHTARTWPLTDLRPTLPPVRDQGNRGTCTAFAVTAAHEARMLGADAALDRTFDLSEEMLYWGCRQGQPRGGSGASLPMAQAALGRQGQPVEALWPYDGDRDEHSTLYVPPAAALDAQNCHRASLHPMPFSTAAIADRLTEGRPVALGVRVGRLFAQAVDGRIPEDPDPSGTGGHAIVMVGYDELDRPQDGGMFVFRNSWGEEWGDLGHGYCSGGWLARSLVGSRVWYVS
ncbi:C1 family peptidase [Deinococcus aestuarii]|uniref:C1 family peptidase n=1 Tax=Deinococcus aestuarii TaxID=2774531 RepID=UPI001C0E8A26|nr:C1 family peptidase [Deinococcus aestuarii]